MSINISFLEAVLEASRGAATQVCATSYGFDFHSIKNKYLIFYFCFSLKREKRMK